jgi:hypothetical protein
VHAQVEIRALVTDLPSQIDIQLVVPLKANSNQAIGVVIFGASRQPL